MTLVGTKCPYCGEGTIFEPRPELIVCDNTECSRVFDSPATRSTLE